MVTNMTSMISGLFPRDTGDHDKCGGQTIAIAILSVVCVFGIMLFWLLWSCERYRYKRLNERYMDEKTDWQADIQVAKNNQIYLKKKTKDAEQKVEARDAFIAYGGRTDMFVHFNIDFAETQACNRRMGRDPEVISVTSVPSVIPSFSPPGTDLEMQTLSPRAVASSSTPASEDHSSPAPTNEDSFSDDKNIPGHEHFAVGDDSEGEAEVWQTVTSSTSTFPVSARRGELQTARRVSVHEAPALGQPASLQAVVVQADDNQSEASPLPGGYAYRPGLSSRVLTGHKPVDCFDSDKEAT